MSAATLRVLIGIFLAAHGLVHYSLTTVPAPAPGALRTPFWPGWWRQDGDPQWLASRMGLAPQAVRTLGCALWCATLAGFVLAGLALVFFPAAPAWQAAAVFGAAASLALLVLYWHPWLVLGAVIDLLVLAALALRWPHSLFSI